MSDIRIGWAKRSITTDENLQLAGHHQPRVATGISSRLYATAVCITMKLTPVIFCSCDTLYIPVGYKQRIIEAIKAEKADFPTDYIEIFATHTHSAYDIELAGEDYQNFFVNQCKSAIMSAYARRVNGYGKLAWGFEHATIAHQKRRVFGNQFTPERNKGDRHIDPIISNFAHYDGFVDTKVTSIFTFDEDNNPTGVIINAPCPAQCEDYRAKVSADFWANVRSKFKDQFGENFYVLPMCGAAGDASPRFLRCSKADAREAKLRYNIEFDPDIAARNHNSADYNKQIKYISRVVSDRIFRAVMDAYEWCTDVNATDTATGNSVGFERVSWVAKSCAEEEATTFAYENDDYKNSLLELAKLNSGSANIADNIPVDADIIRINNLYFVFTGFEVYSEFAYRLQNKYCNGPIIITQLAGMNGSGYLMPEESLKNPHYQNRKNELVGPITSEALVVKISDTIRDMRIHRDDLIQIDQPYMIENNAILGLKFNVYNHNAVTYDNGNYIINTDKHGTGSSTYLVWEGEHLLQAGTYQVFGGQFKFETDTKITYQYGLSADKKTPEQTTFTLNEPTKLTRISLYLNTGVQYDNVQLIPKMIYS